MREGLLTLPYMPGRVLSHGSMCVTYQVTAAVEPTGLR